MFSPFRRRIGNLMNKSKKKPTRVINELEGLRELLDEESASEHMDIPELCDSIPVLSETIPELNEKVDIPASAPVTGENDDSPEITDEQQAPVSEPVPVLTEKISVKIETSTAAVATVEDVDFNIQDQLKQFDAGLPAGHPQNHQDVQVRNELEIEEEASRDTQVTEFLDLQQQEIEVQATQQIQAAPPSVDWVSGEQSHEEILERSWEKVEMLLMENLPPQLSGTFLSLLNARTEENKAEILEELTLLDEETLHELQIALGITKGN